jgi:hypothetical protein
MTLPPLTDWEDTRRALHQAAQVVGAIRKTNAEPLPNYLHYALEVIPNGLTTGKLPDGGEMVLDIKQAAIVYTSTSGDVLTIPTNGKTQVSLMDAVLDAMERAGNPVQPDRAKIGGTDTLNADVKTASDYQGTLYSIYTAIARFKARLFGPMSRMVVWPHGFDLSFLWFARGFDEGSDPHLNFGFSPGSPGFPRPYIYAYAHPKPPGLLDVQLPAPARWNTEPWTGVVIDYDTLAADSDAESTLERLLLDIHASLSPLL